MEVNFIKLCRNIDAVIKILLQILGTITPNEEMLLHISYSNFQ